MITENAEMTKAEANAKLNKEQASFMAARAEKRKAEEMKMAGKRN